MTKNNLRRKVFYLRTLRSYFNMEGSQGRNSRQELKSEATEEHCFLLTCSFRLVWPAFLYHPRPTAQRWPCPVSGALPYQSLLKKMSTDQLYKDIFSIKIPSSQSGHGGTYLWPQHLGVKGGQSSGSLRPTWNKIASTSQDYTDFVSK